VSQQEAQLVLLELDLPQRDGLSCLRYLRAREPGLRMIVHSGRDSAAEIEQALAAGADGFLSKMITSTELVGALHAILAGERRLVGVPSRETFAERARQVGLTKREHQVLQLAAQGESNKTIAVKLWLTEQTVKFHLSNIYRKTRTANRIEASRFAIREGLVEAPRALAPLPRPGRGKPG
jgi:DNA-binding NarL/FixJ family response regulator